MQDMGVAASEPKPLAFSAINEKSRSGGACESLAALLHATFGLDHYPNYLHRWAVSEIEDLEQQLESQLSKVREQKAQLQQWLQVLAEFQPVVRAPAGGLLSGEDPLGALQGVLDARLLAALRGHPGQPEAVVKAVLRKESPEVYSFPALEPAFCAALLENADRYWAFARERCPEV
eukprot:RCo008085